jgi:predicted CoA-substrate-specific enzyme activase
MNKCVVGIDVGAAFAKGIIRCDDGISVSSVMPSGGDYKSTADRILSDLLAQTTRLTKDVACTVATGCGAQMVGFADEVLTDLTCHGKGIRNLLPSVKTIVDVGDSFSTAFRIDERGNLLRFLSNNKCAGGSARVLKVIAKVLQLNVEELGKVSLKSRTKIDFRTNCAVFAESEAVSRIAEGVTQEDLVAGAHRALAAQLVGLAERVGIERDFALVGGGAQDVGLVKAVEERTGMNLVIPPEPHLTAALGAAIAAGEIVHGQ